MTHYIDSLWKDAPEGATNWGRGHVWAKEGSPGTCVLIAVERWLTQIHGSILGLIYSVHGENGLAWGPSEVTDLHERPTHFKSAAQLVDQYRKEHGAEIDESAQDFIDVGGFELDGLIDDAAFALALLERYLTAERARVEGEGR